MITPKIKRFIEPTPQERERYFNLIKSGPPDLYEVARHFDPWLLYALTADGGQTYWRVYILNWNWDEDFEPVVEVMVSTEFNLSPGNFSVTNIDPSILKPCPLPGDGDAVGTLCDGSYSGNDEARALQSMMNARGEDAHWHPLRCQCDVCRGGVRYH